MIEKTYNVGIYCRLSNDDERDEESVSIENQKLLLQSYVRQRGWNEIAVYCDDGYSGTNFDRPGVKRLIEDAKAKKINLILVKDLSRFGRNYIEFGQYTDYLFPSLGCRFIALNNGIDTESRNGSTDVMCFLNLFNEFYSRDTSKKVKAVKRACAESGKFMGTYPAYGYKRDPEDKHHLVIDEETAPTVRRIFSMRASGMGFRAIAVTLNEEGVLPPGALYYQRKGRSDPRNVNHKWAETTVKALIRSEVYIGNMVQGKTGTLSYKSRKLITSRRRNGYGWREPMNPSSPARYGIPWSASTKRRCARRRPRTASAASSPALSTVQTVASKCVTTSSGLPIRTERRGGTAPLSAATMPEAAKAPAPSTPSMRMCWRSWC